MRYRNFWIGALFALLTFVSLTAVFGPGHFGWHHDRWYSDACYHEHRKDHSDDRYTPGAFHEEDSKDEKSK